MQTLDSNNGLRQSKVDHSALIERTVVLLLFLGLLSGVLIVLKPFGIGLMFGAIIAIAAWPVRNALMKRGLSRGQSATLLLLAALASTLVPVLLLVPTLGGRLVDMLDVFRAWLAQSPAPPDWLLSIPLIGKPVQTRWMEIFGSGTNPSEALAPYLDDVSAAIVSAAGSVGQSVLQLILALIIATTFWVQGDELSAAVLDILHRLGGRRLSNMAVLAADAVRGVSYGVVGTAFIQAVLMAGGIWLAGVPAAVPLGFITLLLALSQIGGPLLNLVWGGAAYWLYARGHTGLALWFMVGWGILITLLDGVLKPWLIGSSIRMPLALVIVGVFGGFISFGFLGLFIGPVVIAIAYALLMGWRTGNWAKAATG